MDFEHVLDHLYLHLNECRLHPKETAQQLAQLKPAFQGRLFKNKYQTREGPAALDDLIGDLSRRSPMASRLKWSFALHMAADEQATLLGQKGMFTSEGSSEHRTLPERVKKYAIVKGRLAEVYQFGGRTSEEILEDLLIDDGLASRKRRATLLDPVFNYIGIGSCYHKSHETCTVIILAEDIVSLVAPDAQGTYRRRNGLEVGKQNVIRQEEHRLINGVIGQALINNLVPNTKISIVNPSLNNSMNGSKLPQTKSISEPSFLLEEPRENNQPSSIQPAEERGKAKLQQSGLSSRQPSLFNHILAENQPPLPPPPSISQGESMRISQPQQIPQLESMRPQPQIERPALVENRQGSVVTYEPNPQNEFIHQSLIQSQGPSESGVYNSYRFNSGLSGVSRPASTYPQPPQPQEQSSVMQPPPPPPKKQSRCSVM